MPDAVGFEAPAEVLSLMTFPRAQELNTGLSKWRMIAWLGHVAAARERVSGTRTPTAAGENRRADHGRRSARKI
jgi:hypothetical protein